MANSMTGFGRAQSVLNGREITVEIKSVNSRYFEYSSRLPRGFAYVDDGIKKCVSKSVARGKTEVHLSVQNLQDAQVQISANLSVARGYYEALCSVADDLRIKNELNSSDFLRMSDVFEVRRAQADEDEVKEDVLTVVGEALAQFDAMRGSEAQRLVTDVQSRLDTLKEMLLRVQEGSAGRVLRYTEKLSERLREILQDKAVEESRILTEAAIFADKTAVDEETVRLQSHLEQFAEILNSGGQVGRKLDFLTQEVNREVNTIGSKCQELDITRIVVDMKAEIEKIREQIQNLE